MDPSSAVSLYSSLANLEYLSPDIKSKLESKFVKTGETINNFDPKLKVESLITVAYSNLLLERPTADDLKLVLSALSTYFYLNKLFNKIIYRISRLENEETLSLNSLRYRFIHFLVFYIDYRTFTVAVSYMKCLHKDLYNSLPGTCLINLQCCVERARARIMEILLKYNETKRFKSSIFTDKVN